MLTPAAKKRRVEAANATLKKPFRSPLINRPKPRPAAQTRAAKDEKDDLRPATPLENLQSLEDLDGEPSTSHSPSAQSSPERVHKKVSTYATPRPKTLSPTSELSSLMNKFERQLDRSVRELEQQGELVRQAERIRQTRRPGEEVDKELKELVEKWKGASRLAAEEVFGFVKERVAR
jgi:Swi5-dependent recombination DNA repair protein 1